MSTDVPNKAAYIKKLEISNFKSFKHIDIELKKFNVLIGANASGKSNFVHIFRFLKDIVESGLDNAISMQGGVKYLRNINIGSSENLSVKIVSKQESRLLGRDNKKNLIGIKTYEIIYKFTINFNKRGSGFQIVEDNLTQRCEFFKLEKKNKKIKEEKSLGKGEIIALRSNKKVEIKLNTPRKVSLKKEDIFPLFFQSEKIPDHALLIEVPYILIITSLRNIISNIAIRDFDPKLPKKAIPITGKANLEEDGRNLSVVLKNILQKKTKREKLLKIMQDTLPFIEKLFIKEFVDKSLLFELKESYFKKKHLPGSFISDGTINIMAIIISLYFEKKPLIVLEEPERNIHPSLISRIIDMIKDASRKKQIIVTTHNPEFVRHAGLESLLLITRDENGFSNIYRPADKEEVKTFLENDIGIEELYIQNLL